MWYLKKKKKKSKSQSVQLYMQHLRHTYHIYKVKHRRWRQLTWFQIGQKGISHSHSFRSSTCQSHSTWGLNSLNTPVRRFKDYCVKEQSRKLWQRRNFQELPETSLAEHTAAEVEFLLREKQLPLLKAKTRNLCKSAQEKYSPKWLRVAKNTDRNFVIIMAVECHHCSECTEGKRDQKK